MTKGYWKCANAIATIANDANIDIRSVFDMETRVINKEIAALKANIESSLPMSSINPAFQWAQSGNEVFINVKFAHKLDAPATLNVEAHNVSIDTTGLVLRASDGRKMFNLDIEFLKEIVPENSTWSMASVGRMTLTLQKKNGPLKWSRLTKGRKKPNNIHFWWELHDKYASELENLGDEDDESEEDTDKSSPSKTSDNSTSEASEAKSEGKNEVKKKPRKVKKKRDRTPEEEMYHKEKQKLTKEMKQKIAEIEADVAERKQVIDTKASEEKSAIDDDATIKKNAIKDEYALKIKDAEALLGLHAPEVKNVDSSTDSGNSEL
eukprot:CAMPEP_0185030670 /NCGR_PEP_ID=MMETSP1103-20130426/17668_1 /TAXON_ID=36769 /ORGANISM="Paraphysomonas bandaiensis, Strain Caron Lab Isolate" /LENGTH=321 /DNA_ID=CAMNT_0027565883 /DNA_START=184 /DNA_END=1149 /DNA_ORIENTATION=+